MFILGIVASGDTDIFVNLAAGLFILPFFLFSATAGQIADKYEKSRLVRIIKLVEIGVALLAGLAVFFAECLCHVGGVVSARGCNQPFSGR